MGNAEEKVQTIYYDGSCPLCSVFADTVATSSKKEGVVLKDITRDPLPADFSMDAVQKEMHVVGKDGVVYKNADAILEVLSQYPLWRPIVWLGRLPGMRALLPYGYNALARNRHAISRLLHVAHKGTPSREA